MQVSRTDANVLFELDPQDLEVIQQMNYSSVIPEVQVCPSMLVDRHLSVMKHENCIHTCFFSLSVH